MRMPGRSFGLTMILSGEIYFPRWLFIHAVAARAERHNPGAPDSMGEHHRRSRWCVPHQGAYRAEHQYRAVVAGRSASVCHRLGRHCSTHRKKPMMVIRTGVAARRPSTAGRSSGAPDEGSASSKTRPSEIFSMYARFATFFCRASAAHQGQRGRSLRRSGDIGGVVATRYSPPSARAVASGGHQLIGARCAQWRQPSGGGAVARGRARTSLVPGHRCAALAP